VETAALDVAPQFDLLGQKRGAGGAVLGAFVGNSEGIVARQFGGWG